MYPELDPTLHWHLLTWLHKQPEKADVKTARDDIVKTLKTKLQNKEIVISKNYFARKV